MLAHIREQLSHHLASDNLKPLGQMGVFHCCHPQHIHRVPIHHPSLILVVEGEKRLHSTTQVFSATAGNILLLPANTEIEFENLPAPATTRYFALCLSFFPETVSRFLQSYGQSINWDTPSQTIIHAAPEALLVALSQRLTWCMKQQTMDLVVNDLRQQELLAICAQYQLLGQLLQARQPLWRQRVAAIVATDTAFDWRIESLCQRLGTSESVLRRHLQQEDASFRDILAEVRLVSALGLLQETQMNIADVAARVGYQSQSRFAEKFKRRFGLTPSQLKASRQ